MVVLSAAIATSGKTLLARQFVEMTRVRAESLLSAFPNLLDSGWDHTYIETETVRYVYQPMDSVFLLLITNRSSNILEDLETVRCLAKVVRDCCEVQASEEQILKHSFDIIFAFDEVVSFGHRDSVTCSQVKTYTEMNSHDEDVQRMIEKSKINEVREIARKKQIEIAKDLAKKPKIQRARGTPIESIEDQLKGLQPVSPGCVGDNLLMPPVSGSTGEELQAQTFQGRAPKKSMKLPKKMHHLALNDFLDGPESEPLAAATEQEAASEKPLPEPISVEIEERITANLTAGGDVQGEVECQGSFQVTVVDAATADLPCFRLSPLDPKFKYRAHPNLNKQSWAGSILEMKDASKALKANSPTPLMTWRRTAAGDALLPISASCWPSGTADGTAVVLELELQDGSQTLEEVHVSFPAPARSRPAVRSADAGEAWYDEDSQRLH